MIGNDDREQSKKGQEGRIGGKDEEAGVDSLVGLDAVPRRDGLAHTAPWATSAGQFLDLPTGIKAMVGLLAGLGCKPFPAALVVCNGIGPWGSSQAE